MRQPIWWMWMNFLWKIFTKCCGFKMIFVKDGLLKRLHKDVL